MVYAIGMHDALRQIRRELRDAADPSKAAYFPRFFKTGPGAYAEGDRFIGVTVPTLRVLARRHADLPLGDVLRLLRSGVHEERAFALILLVTQFKRADIGNRRRLFKAYMSHLSHIDNWDLVDMSAPYIVGAWLDGKGMRTLERLARSKDLWERRIAIVATFHDIRKGRCAPTLRIATMLLGDPHDLIHKAVGWMLREVGKRSTGDLTAFLHAHAPGMPRTMLRYAIERFAERERRAWMRIGKDRA
jgi:3-methyladenine DNA glycosylase AlkD